MIDYGKMQLQQRELDDYIIRSKGLQGMTDQALLSNMILALHDEILEVEEAPLDPTEYIDCLHFVLSIANKMGFKLHGYIGVELRGVSLIDIYEGMRYALLRFTRHQRGFKHWSDKKVDAFGLVQCESSLNAILEYISLACKKLGVDLVKEYDTKYQINIERQRKGY